MGSLGQGRVFCTREDPRFSIACSFNTDSKITVDIPIYIGIENQRTRKLVTKTSKGLDEKCIIYLEYFVIAIGNLKDVATNADGRTPTYGDCVLLAFAFIRKNLRSRRFWTNTWWKCALHERSYFTHFNPRRKIRLRWTAYQSCLLIGPLRACASCGSCITQH